MHVLLLFNPPSAKNPDESELDEALQNVVSAESYCSYSHDEHNVWLTHVKYVLHYKTNLCEKARHFSI